MATRSRSLFDIVGPVMIGPSSSHTAGAVRLGLLARAILGEEPVAARIELHGSFALTGPGHGTDLALVAGLLGMAMDDPRIPDALAATAQHGLSVTFERADLGEVHPNSARFILEGERGGRVCVTGSSLGGAEVVVVGIDEFDVAITGELPVLVVAHIDRPGVIAAVTAAVAAAGANIASMQDSRERRGERALMLIATDSPVDDATLTAVAAVPDVTAVRAVPAV
jgi:L-serine dehydratase